MPSVPAVLHRKAENTDATYVAVILDSLDTTPAADKRAYDLLLFVNAARLTTKGLSCADRELWCQHETIGLL